MLYVLASVVCSVAVSVLLKLARRFRIDVDQAVAWNYVVAAGATLLALRPEWTPLSHARVPWLALVLLGILLPTIFLALAASVRSAGIVRSDAAQRLSLVLSLVAAFTLFGESLTLLKLAGCALGLLAMAGMVWRGGATARVAAGGKAWLWPLVVFAGFGIIDILFKRVAASGVPLGSALAIVFALALLVACVIALARRTRWSWRGCAGGVVLGLCNFGNILFYLRAHRALPHDPALVFAGVNLGVVALGAVVGMLAFRERLGRINLAALALALVAIAVLTLA
ncbi:MAG TPA: EamA family transporter [Rhodanobacteraceae bacterium]|jgi:drug/metabolite transporter (DMT)-like permease|nr:EamA family transporter [Rhodanobacteraceae bacterium]